MIIEIGKGNGFSVFTMFTIEKMPLPSTSGETKIPEITKP
jgi:hypothetical protein